MQIIRKRAFARAGLLGNPSDGFHGKTISLIVRNFYAEAVLYEWDRVELVLSDEDKSSFDSIHELADDVHLHGYYGGIRLVKATIKCFADYCEREAISLDDRKFSIRYATNIPRQVGLAGSSAIIVATLRALCEFFEVTIPLEIQPSLVLSVETRELGIAGGLQDRVIQVYEGLVFMDFSREVTHDSHGFQCGVYEPLPVENLPNLYIAYSTRASEPTELTHGPLRARYEAGLPNVVAAMDEFANLAVLGRQAIQAEDTMELNRLINANFDLRKSICDLSTSHELMIQQARLAGATAKYCGSGGAIIGTYQSPAMLNDLRTRLSDCRVFAPEIVAEA